MKIKTLNINTHQWGSTAYDKFKWNYKIMLNYTIAIMCMNNIKNNLEKTNTLCRITLLFFFIFFIFL